MNRPSTRHPSVGSKRLAAGLISLLLGAGVAACGGPPEDRSEARQRVTAVAESLRAAHAERWGVATPEELSRLRADSLSEAD